MTAVLIFVGLILLVNYFENNKRRKEQDDSVHRFVDDLDKMVAERLDSAMAKADQIAEENGVDLQERFSKD